MPRGIRKNGGDPRCVEMGKRLFDARRAKNFDREELARRAHCSGAAIAAIETGHSLMPAAQTILACAQVLNVRAHWLVFGEGDKHPAAPFEMPKPVEIERVPVELSRCLIKLVEEMQYARLFTRDHLDSHHLDRWLGTLLQQPQLAALRDHMLRMPDETEQGAVERPAVPATVDNAMPAPSANVSVLSDRRMSAAGDPVDRAAPVARLTAPGMFKAEPEPTLDADPTNVVKFSLDPMRGDKLGFFKKGSYTHTLIEKAKGQKRKDGKLRILDVCGALGISTATFHLWKTNDPDFPKPIPHQDGNPAYDKKDVERYLALKVMQRKNNAPLAKAK